MSFAALFSIESRQSPYFIKDNNGQFITEASYFYTGDFLQLFRTFQDSGIMVAQIAIAIATISPEDSLSIRVLPILSSKKPQSMILKIGMTKALPGYTDVKVLASEVFKL